MSDDGLDDWAHAHTFGQELQRPGERRTFVVIAITATMMVVEIVAGLAFASMALLADGLHMASHTAALGISAFAYIYARRHARDGSFSFGTGKVNALAGFSGAVLLAAFALVMAAGSVERLVNPEQIQFGWAITVAVLGLAVNGLCVLILDVDEHDDARAHDDHNLRSAYLHVLADVLTSVLAIVALLGARYLDAVWMDPVMGLVGAVLVARWSFGLLRVTSRVLLDRRPPGETVERIRAALEADGASRVADLHLWSIGPGLLAAEIVVVSRDGLSPATYKALLPADIGLAHIAIEVHRTTDDTAGGSRSH